MSSNPFPVCAKCGVAFDTGKKYCTTKWCDLHLPEDLQVKRPRKRYIYPSKKVDLIYSRWSSIQRRAKKREYQFDLCIDDIKLIIASPCTYCGSTERIEVDRKDNTLGYIRGNCVPACHRCNTIKNNVVSYDDMLFIAEHLGWRL